MSYVPFQYSHIKLSICISTFNRAAFIGATLDSILCQLTSECEVVILDAASTDDTSRIVSEYAQRSRQLRYFRQETNDGIDRDYDRVIGLARGEYCWLMTDDDIVRPMALATILKALQRNLSLIIVNAELRDFTLQNIVQGRWLDFDSDRVYGPGDMDRLFMDVGGWLNCHFFLIKRDLWMVREKERYFGSLHMYLGVIFQEPLPTDALVIAEPQVNYRRGNAHTFSNEIGATIWDKWPSVVESLALSESAKRSVPNAQPWRHGRELLWWRARGYYSILEYRRWIRPRLRSIHQRWIPRFVALLPGAIVNAALILYYSLIGESYGLRQRDLLLQELSESRYYFRGLSVFHRRPRRGGCRHDRELATDKAK